MDQPEVELGQIATWLSEQGLSPGSPEKAQLCLLWRAHQHTRSCLSSVTRDLDIQRSQHVAEMAEVRKSLEQIRIFTKHKDALAQQIQDENDHLKDQLQRLISRQDAQISEVAKMLYQQGLTELIHSSPSEQVAYLLVERASLLEMSRDPDNPTSDANTMSTLGTETQVSNHHAQQSPHKGAPRHGLSPWKRLLGLHRASQSKHVFIPAGPRHLTSEASSVERQCSRLEWDLEEGSRRLAMAHNEIRRLTDELESAHLTRRAYEPELQAAQQEVKQLRQEVEKLNNYEMVELQKAKDLNNRLDLEIRALRSRVRSLDAGKSSLQQMVLSLQEEKERLEAALQHQTEQQLLAEQVQPDQAMELAKVASLQKEVERLQSALQEQQQQQLLTVQVQANQANELAKSQETELNQRYDICRDLQNKLSAQTKCLLEKESEIHSLKQDNTLKDLGNLTANIYTKENIEDQSTPWQVEDSFTTEDKELHTQLYKKITLNKECPDYQETVRTLLTTQEECESLKEEICETLKCIDKERSKYHETKEKHKAKLCRAKQKFDDETTQRDEKIKSLERELSLCSHSLAKEKELVISITRENDKLLVERRRLLQQLSEEEHNKEESHLTASLSKCRVDFLEMENKKLVNKTLHMSNQLAILDRTLQNMQSLHFAEELKKIYPQRPSASPSVQTSSVMVTEPSKIQTLLDDTESDHTKQTVMTLSPRCLISVALSRSAEMGYLNLTSTQNCSDTSGALNSSESV